MFKNKTFFTLILSAIAIIFSGVIAISCTSNEDVQEINSPIAEELAVGNDTIYVETETPIIKKAGIDSVSEKTLNIIRSSQIPQTRSTSETEVLYLYNEWTEKWAYAVANPNKSNSWIFECHGSNTQESIIILFEQVGSNEFITKDENGNVLRHFTYDPEKQELWTFNNPTTRGMSTQDKILCNSMFAAANYLVAEALAIPTGGLSLAICLGFAVASTYVCD